MSSSSEGSAPRSGEDTCFVKKGIQIDEPGPGETDSLTITENTFKYIDQTGLELNLPDETEIIVGNPTPALLTVGAGDSTNIQGNEFINVNCVYDFRSAQNTTVSWTAAWKFDLAIRTNDHQPIFGKVLSTEPLVFKGGDNYFWNPSWADPDSAFVVVTDPLEDSLYAKNCSWNSTSCNQLDADLFIVNEQALPNGIALDPCNMGTLLQFPWGGWPDLKTGQGPRPESSESSFSLGLPAPNPSGQVMSMSFAVPGTLARTGGRLVIYDTAGRAVREFRLTLELQGRIVWDGRDSGDGEVPSGVYFARLEAGGKSATRKLIIVR